MPPQTTIALGTVCSINLYKDGTPERYNEIFQRLYEIERLATINTPITAGDEEHISEIQAVNNAAGKSEVRVSSDVFAIVSCALDIAEKTDGAFNPAIGAIVKAWNISAQIEKGVTPSIPSAATIESLLPLARYEAIHLNAQDSSIYIETPGTMIDCGGIAKGYACDEIAKLIKQWNIESALVNLGGNIYTVGNVKNANGTTRPFLIGVKTPFDPEGEPFITLNCEDTSVVTSGIYERFIEVDGKKYHHIIDPKTGSPAESGLVSATIICKSSMLADALSTACIVLGKDAAQTLLKSFPETKSILVESDGNIIKNE